MDYLYESPNSQVSSPVSTKKQALPFNELSWEDFERLTLSYADTKSGVEKTARLYGVKGNKQEGIDIYARNNSSEVYDVYQCKRYKKYSAAKVKLAVQKFMEGEWYQKSNRFFLCVSCDLSNKTISDEIEKQKKILNQDGKEFHVLDVNSYSMELKKFPEIVYDFFGKAWAEEFLNANQLSLLSNRLLPSEIQMLKKELGVFYKTLFDTHENSIMNLSGENAIPDFESRYILPDITLNISLHEPLVSQPEKQKEKQISLGLVEGFSPEEYEFESLNDYNINVETEIQQKFSSLEWIAAEKNCILVGGPGSGKSALLKYIVLLLLNVYRSSDRVLFQSYHSHIPVWLPFGFWTSLLKSSPNIGLLEALKAWFEGHSRMDLWPLVEKALKDKRLLLLIDGLDEWSDENAAIICFNKLCTFIRSQDISSIFTTRPSSLERLSIPPEQWSVAQLSGLDTAQKKQLAKICIGYRISNSSGIDANYISMHINKAVKEFESEVINNIELSELSEIPLMVYMLIHLKTKNISIPHSKFLVYKDLVSDLVKVQPKRRRSAAQVVQSNNSFNDNELFEIFSNLAYKVQLNHSYGVINVGEAKKLIIEYLKNPNEAFGFDIRDAKNSAEEILRIGESDIGLIVKKSPDEIGFLHRSFQEFMCAHYISLIPISQQLTLLSKNLSSPQWLDVFICLFSLIQKKPEIEEIVNFLSKPVKNSIDSFVSESLLAYIAFGDNKCSAEKAKELAQNTINKILDRTYYPPQREKLLDIALSGYSSNKVQSIVKSLIDSSYVCNTKWASGVLIAAAKHWPRDELTDNFILSGLLSEDIYSIKESSKILSDNYSGNGDIINSLFDIVKTTYNRNQRLVISEAIFRGWKLHPLSKTLYNTLKKSQDPVEELLCILYESLNGKTTKKAREFLLGFDKDIFHWGHIVTDCLVRDFGNDIEIRDLCIGEIFKGEVHPKYKIGYDLACEYLAECYWDDEVFINCLIEDFKTERPSFCMISHKNYAWDNVGKIMKISPLLKVQVESWIIQHGKVGTHSLFYLTSNEGKQYLIKELSSGFSFPQWPAQALVENWGVNDEEVSKAINDYISRGPIFASKLSFLFPKIYTKDEYTSKLLDLLDGQYESQKRYDFICSAIINNCDKKAILAAYGKLTKLKLESESITSGSWLLLYFYKYSEDSSLIDLAKEYVIRRDSNSALIAKVFSHDNNLRELISKTVIKLESNYRMKIASFLKGRNFDSYCFEKLKDYDLDINPSVKVNLASGYYSAPYFLINSNEKDDAIKLLVSDINAVGMDRDERIQAAFVGLVELGKTNTLPTIKQRYDNNKGICVEINNYLDSSEFILKYVADNWVILFSEFKENIYEFFGYEGDRFLSLLSLLSPYIGVTHPLYYKLKDKLDSGVDSTNINDRLLYSLSRLFPKSSFILDICLSSLGLRKNISSQNVYHNESLVALTILETQFKFEERAMQKVLETDISQVREDVLLSSMLAIGLESSPEGKKLQKSLEGKPVWLPLHILAINKGNKSSEEYACIILDMLPYFKEAPSNYSIYFYKKLVATLSESSDLTNLLESKLPSIKKIQNRLFILQLLVGIKGYTIELEDMVVAMYQAQKRQKFPVTIYDVKKGQYSIAEKSLLDLASNIV